MILIFSMIVLLGNIIGNVNFRSIDYLYIFVLNALVVFLSGMSGGLVEPWLIFWQDIDPQQDQTFPIFHLSVPKRYYLVRNLPYPNLAKRV